MKRRTFLNNAGLIIPVALFAPSQVIAARSINTTADVIVIKGGFRRSTENVTSLVNATGRRVQEIGTHEIRELVYSHEGFLIHTTSGQTFTSEKLIFNTTYKIDSSQFCFLVGTDNNDLRLNYDTPKNKKRVQPEFWSFRAEKIGKERLHPFLQRKKHAFMSMS